jgi:hypothetical protein
MRKFVLFSTLTLTAICASSQHGLPRLIAYAGDTLVLVGTDQIIIANVVNQELRNMYQLNDSLRTDLQRHKVTLIRMEDALTGCQRVSLLRKEEVEVWQDKATAWERQADYERKRGRRARGALVGVGVAVVSAAVLVLSNFKTR